MYVYVNGEPAAMALAWKDRVFALEAYPDPDGVRDAGKSVDGDYIFLVTGLRANFAPPGQPLAARSSRWVDARPGPCRSLVARRRGLLPEAPVAQLAGVRHYPPWEAPDDVVATLERLPGP